MSDHPEQPRITHRDGVVTVESAAYCWRWAASDDIVELCDASGTPILSHPLQPAFEVAGASASCGGTYARHAVEGDRLEVAWTGANGDAEVSLAVRFAPTHLVFERTVYAPATAHAVVRYAWLATMRDGRLAPAGTARWCVVPGGKQDPEQAIFPLDPPSPVRFSVGCFGNDTGTHHQQWALPHYFTCAWTERGAAACIGLGAFPDGNVMVETHGGALSYEINVRGDLWKHRAGPGSIVFDDPLLIAAGGDWYGAARKYFGALVEGGYARRRVADVPEAAFLAQYDTWGDQILRRAFLGRFNEQALRDIHADVRASGIAARLFVIDDKWEGVYGSLEHDVERFPSFAAALDEIRADGYGIGLWTAFPRCEDYAALGLDADAVLKDARGEPYVVRERDRAWYIFDPTNEHAAAHLRERARHLVRTYRPSMVKIDFGYEIPRPDVAGPADPARGGERLFLEFLRVVVGAIREEDPRIAILYYCITPLVGDYIDLSGADDLWMSRRAYDAGFARRALLSSLCGAFGMVPYGSTGYDWRSAPSIWLDTAVIGTPGIIAPLVGDEYGECMTPMLAARYNGVARVARQAPLFDVAFFDAELYDAAAGPIARSWGRIEDGWLVLAALRGSPERPAAIPGVVSAACDAVIASLDAEAIVDSPSIAVVPFGAGRVEIERAGAVHATAHLFGGRTAEWPARSARGRVVLDVDTATTDGTPVEWIEVRANSRSSRSRSARWRHRENG